MPKISPYERETVERRLQALQAELYALPDQPDMPSHIFAIRVRKLVADIQELKHRLGAAMATPPGHPAHLALHLEKGSRLG
jgi:hypothetical protein